MLTESGNRKQRILTPSIAGLKENARLRLDGHWREAARYSFIILVIMLPAYALISRYFGVSTAFGAVAGASVAFIVRILVLLFVYGAFLHFLKMIRTEEIITGEDGIPRDKWGRPVLKELPETVEKNSGTEDWKGYAGWSGAKDQAGHGTWRDGRGAETQTGYGGRSRGAENKTGYNGWNGGYGRGSQPDYSRTSYAVSDAQDPAKQLADLIAVFKMQPDRFIIYGIITGGLAFAPVVPLAVCAFSGTGTAAWLAAGVISAGIFIVCTVLRLMWAMTPFILLDAEGQLTVEKAMRQSRKMMRGRKKNLFLLFLSFLGWALLVLLTFGIGLIWIIPYLIASYCGFYDAVDR